MYANGFARMCLISKSYYSENTVDSGLKAPVLIGVIAAVWVLKTSGYLLAGVLRPRP